MACALTVGGLNAVPALTTAAHAVPPEKPASAAEGWSRTAHWRTRPDGKVETELYAGPTFTRRGGTWRPIDARVRETRDAAAPFAAPDAVLPMRFGTTAARLVDIPLERGGVRLSATDLRIGRPELAGNGVVYRDVATDTDLVVEPTGTGFRTKYVLRSARAPRSFTLRLDDPNRVLGDVHGDAERGWTFSEQVEGDLTVGVLPGFAYEQSDDLAGIERGSAHLAIRRDGDGFVLTKSVDEQWLRGKTFPIVLDPQVHTMTGGIPEEVTDCHIVSGSRIDTNYCPSTSMEVGYSTNDLLIRRMLLKFDFSMVPVGSRIDTGYVSLFLQNVFNSQSALTVDAYEVNASWDTSVTWRKRNATTNWSTAGGTTLSGTRGSKSYSYIPGTYQDMTLNTAMLQGWHSNPSSNHGMLLRARSETVHNVFRFGAVDDPWYGYRPKLWFSYTPAPAAPGNVNAVGDRTRAFVTWNAANLQSGSAVTEYRVTASCASSGCTNDSTVYTCGGTCTSMTVPRTGGHSYTFSVRAVNADGLTGPPGTSQAVAVRTNAGPSAPTDLSPAAGAKLSATPDECARYNDPEGDLGTITVNLRTASQTPITTMVSPSVGALALGCVDSPDLADGDYVWDATASDGLLSSATTAAQGFTVDSTAPAAPAVTSSSHPNQSAWYPNATATLQLTASDTSGILGYSYSVDSSDVTLPDTTVDVSASPLTVSNLPDGAHWVHVRACNGAALCSAVATHFKVQVDRALPSTPGGVTTSHVANGSSNDRTIDASWAASTDATSGVVGYATAFTQSATTDPDAATAVPGTSVVSPTLTDGVWHFHLRAVDKAGNATPTLHLGPFRIDGVVPSVPVVSSTTHTADVWSPSRSVSFLWTATDDASGVVSWSYSFDSSPSAVPDDVADTTASGLSLIAPEGVSYFHIKARDAAGNWSATAQFNLRTDVTAPAASTSLTTTHPAKSNDPTIDVTWSAASDPLSGLAGYSWLWSTSATAVPDATIDSPTATSTTSPALADGSWYFSVVAIDTVGNVSVVKRIGPLMIDTVLPTTALALSRTPDQGADTVDTTDDVYFANPTLTCTNGDDRSGVLRTEYRWNGGAWTTWTCGASGSLTIPSAGTFLLEFRTLDEAGNVEVVKSRTLTFDPDAVAQTDEAGMEQFFPLHDLPLGTGTAYVHLRSGNLVAQYDDNSVPGVGLNTVLRRTYNSARRGSNPHGLGLGWSLSAADLDVELDDVSEDGALVDLALGSELALPTQQVVNGALVATGYRLDFTDGDGTAHRFVRRGGPGSRWDSPPGVNLRVFEVLDPNAQAVATSYRLVRPDGVEYVAQRLMLTASNGTPLTPTWRVTSIVDRRGNQLSYDYTVVSTSATDHVVRLAAIRHNRGNRTTATFTYDPATANLTTATALPGYVAADPATGTSRSWERVTSFDVDASGQLRSVTELSNRTVADGRRTTTFGYATGTPGLLTSVTDARGYATTFGYTAGAVTSVVDRRQKSSTIGYGSADANGGRTTTVTVPVSTGVTSTTSYKVSGRSISSADNRLSGGNIVEIVDAGNNLEPVRDTYAWTSNRLVTHTDGGNATTSYTYTDVGLLSTVTEPAPSTQPLGTQSSVVSTLTYDYPDSGPGSYRYDSRCTEPASPSGTVTGEGRCHAVAQMTRMAAAVNVPGQLRVTDFHYDAVGNMVRAIQRANPSTSSAPSALPGATDRATTFAYYNRGILKQVDGPRTDVSDVTKYGEWATDAAQAAGYQVADPDYGGYDVTGMPKVLRDGLGKTKQFSYTPFGLVGRLVDRDGRVTTSEHSDLDNITKVVDPAGHVSRYAYDGNENKVSETSEGNEVTSFVYDENGWLLSTTSPGSVAGTTQTDSSTYFDDGTVKTTTNARGAVVTYDYWPNRSQKSVTAPAATGQTAVTSYEYDRAGRLVRTVEPVSTASGLRPETRISHSPQGLPEVETHTDPAGGFQNTVRTAHNAHGEAVAASGPRSQSSVEAQSTTSYNVFGDVVSTLRRLSPSRSALSEFTYDAAGNQVSSTQATGNGEKLTSRYTFDALGQITGQVEDPINPTHQTRYTYSGEGQQLTRVDGVMSASVLVPKRTVAFTFNDDNTQRSMVVTDHTNGKTLASCNWADGAAPSSGYDVEGNLLVTRTVVGTTGCTGGATLREQTFEYDRRDWLVGTTQKVRARALDPFVTRTQTFEYESDGSRKAFTHNGQRTSFTTSLAGWMESMTDWRSRVTTASYLASGDVSSSVLGGGVARIDLGYLVDGSVSSLTWKNQAGTLVRSHTGIAYDVAGLRQSEVVNVLQPTGSTAWTGGTATFGYDLADRLTGWTSPFKQNASDNATPQTSFTLDDGGNITYETTSVSGSTRTTTTSTYTTGRLTRRVVDTAPLGITPATQEDTTFGYDELGEENNRTETTKSAGVTTGTETTATAFDPAGHTASSTVTATDAGGADVPRPDVEFVYDTADRLIARIEKPTQGSPQTRLYFYSGASGALVEETDGAGRTLVRYLVDPADETLAQHAFRANADGTRDTADTAGTWTWLLIDAAGSVGTLLSDTGTVVEQNAYDPFGRGDRGGTGRGAGQPAASASNLGFQSALTDKVTGNVVLGARQYDPTTARFTTPDFFVASSLDVELGTDALNGNRYLFASANPVAFFDDGHWGFMKKLKNIAKRALPVLAFVPVVSTAIDAVSAATGRDWLDGGRRLTGAERLMMLGGVGLDLVTGGTGGRALKAGRMAARSVDKFKTARKAGKAVSCAANSFTAETPVVLADGSTKPIADVDVGDVVLATDEATGETRGRPVTHLIRGTGVKRLVDIAVEGESITATDKHPMYVVGRGFVDAQDVSAGDLLRTAEGDSIRVLSAMLRQETLTVYNLTVDVAHTYYVGDDVRVLVHNAKPCGKTRSVAEMASDFKRKVGKNSYSIPTTPDRRGNPRRLRIDMEGRAHNGVKTPHVGYDTYHRKPGTDVGRWKKAKKVRPATKSDIRAAKRHYAAHGRRKAMDI